MSDSSNFRLFNPGTMAKPVAGYSHVAEVTGGKLVYIAGQVALDGSGNLVGKDDFHTQVEQVFKNLNAAVQAAGGTFHDVIKLNYYCAESVDPSALPQVREVRDKYVNTKNPQPAPSSWYTGSSVRNGSSKATPWRSSNAKGRLAGDNAPRCHFDARSKNSRKARVEMRSRVEVPC